MKADKNILRQLNKKNIYRNPYRKRRFSTKVFVVLFAVLLLGALLLFLTLFLDLPFFSDIEMNPSEQNPATADTVTEFVIASEAVTAPVAVPEIYMFDTAPAPDLPVYQGFFDLPLNGATGWVAVYSVIRNAPDMAAEVIFAMPGGTPFTIIREQGSFWYIRLTDGSYGYIPHSRAFINLPDILPSMIFYISNATASVKRSGGWFLPGITGYALYNAYSFNPRLDRYEFIVPSLYSSAVMLAQAHRNAIENGDIIILYEAFRPMEAQTMVRDALSDLIYANSSVANTINFGGWHVGWFISQDISDHQRGAAFDVHLARILETESVYIGDFTFTRITNYARYPMISNIHELSPAAAIVTAPVNLSFSQWQEMTLPAHNTEGGLRLFNYMVEAGFMPIASEWWHFTDQAGNVAAAGINVTGNFFTETIFSEVPYG
ncbi:MAG: hypothetical protein FWG63_11690 [Defluviitaleaceae bacterium]|nr:hypothetical protein [Defluviitaleaceae bacterium]